MKIKPSVRVKTSSRVHKKKKPSRIRVKVKPRREGIEKQVRSSVGSPHSLQDSVNVSSLVDDYTSSIDSVIDDDRVIEDENISEILALLESARTRSQDFLENETVHENILKPKNARTKRRPEKYY